SKSSAISDIQALPRRKHYCQIYQMINLKWCQVVKHILRGRLLASFQDLEHEEWRHKNRKAVKEYQENDKIGTKPDQIKKKWEAWQSSEKSKAVSVNKGRKTEQNVKRRAKSAKSTTLY
nr:hypothetical protein [Tanacetum cinerariifolium]